MADKEKQEAPKVEINQQLAEALAIIASREARAAKKEEEQEKKAQHDLEAKARDMRENAIQAEQVARAKRLGCQHARYNRGERTHLWRGQVNADGYVRPLCLECQTEMPKFKATEQMLKDGVNLNAYPSLDVSMLEKWHKISFPKGCTQGNCHVCHPVEVAV